MRPRCLVVYEVLWVLSRYEHLAEAKIIKHRLSPLRLAPTKMPGSSKAYRGQPHLTIVQATRKARASETLRGMRGHGAIICLVSFRSEDNSRLLRETVSKAVGERSSRSSLSRSVNGPDPRQANDRQPIVGSPWGSELIRYRVPRRWRMPSFDQVWAWLSEVICILHAKEHVAALREHDKHPRNRLDVLIQE
jgi:hypothetical protein